MRAGMNEREIGSKTVITVHKNNVGEISSKMVC